jgi:hypothetical protein
MPQSSEIRSRVKMSDADIIEHFARLGFDVTIDELVFTSETVEDFAHARESVWHRGGDVERYEAQGILVVSGAQPKVRQPIRDVVVVSLFHARVVLGVLPTAFVDPHLPRYATTMG